ncbi:MAG: hypothetical protein GF353_26905 [Candidatus Lokiarchaeota archaeon]|nr:hypothetical protein [Candidatus Lokiarchaeota archaeon]
MPKYKKRPEKLTKSKKQRIRKREQEILKTIRISALLGGIFLLISFLFNVTHWFEDGIITKIIARETLWDIVDNSIKALTILLCFLFMTTSIGNYKELTGKPLKLWEVIVLVGLSLLQTFRNFWVFLIASISLGIAVFYLYLVQD